MLSRSFKTFKNEIKTEIVNNDGRNHYVYRITNFRTNKHYYGSRVTKLEPKDDLGIKYFSSSSDKEFLKEQKENPDNFKYKIIKVFNNKTDCIIMEMFLHQYFDVKNNINFINKSNQQSISWTITGNKCLYDKVLMTKGIIDPNTKMTVFQSSAIKASKTMQKVGTDGKTTYERSNIKRLKTRSIIDPNTGLTINDVVSIKNKKIKNSIDPNTGLSFAKTVGLKIKGINHHSFKGYYIFNNIMCTSCYRMSKLLNLSRSSIEKYCKNSDLIITSMSYNCSKFLREMDVSIIGKTYNDVGFDYVEVDTVINNNFTS